MIAAGLFVLAFAILVAARVVSIQLHDLRKALMAGVPEVTAALDQLDTSIAALATAVGNVQAPPDLQPIVDRINAEKAQVDAQTTALGGQPPSP